MRDHGSEAKGDVDWVVVVSGEAADDLCFGLGAQLESVVARLTSPSAMRRRLRGGSESPVSKGVYERGENERVSGSCISNREGGGINYCWRTLYEVELNGRNSEFTVENRLLNRGIGALTRETPPNPKHSEICSGEKTE